LPTDTRRLTKTINKFKLEVSGLLPSYTPGTPEIEGAEVEEVEDGEEEGEEDTTGITEIENAQPEADMTGLTIITGTGADVMDITEDLVMIRYQMNQTIIHTPTFLICRGFIFYLSKIEAESFSVRSAFHQLTNNICQPKPELIYRIYMEYK